MITLIALLLIVSLLPACAVASMAEVEDDALLPDPAQMVPPVQEVINYTVDFGVWEDEAQAGDGTTLASYRFQLPVLAVCREDGTAIEKPETEAEEQAIEVAAAFNNKFSKWAAAEEFRDLVDRAAEDLAWHRAENYKWAGGYTMELDCCVYQTEQMVSVSGVYYSDTGGAHPNTYLLGWNFDLEDGTFFGPELLADSAELQQAASEELIRQARETAEFYGAKPEEFFWQDYEDILADWSSYTVFFDETGMAVAFSPYELAAYAAGPQEFHLSYDWLGPYLSEHGRRVLGLNAAE